MIHFRPGSQVHRLVTVLAVVGEIPTKSVHLLGNERVYKILIHKLTTVQEFRNSITGEELTCRLLTVTGKGQEKGIRFYKAGLPILRWIGAEEYYLRTFWGHRFPGDAYHRDRHYRIAETVAMIMEAGIESRPYLLPKLQNQELLSIVPQEPSFYPAKELKYIGQTEMNKTMFTRMVGALFVGPVCYAVYNTRNAVMKWSGMGEFKTLQNLNEIARQNAGITRVNSALLFTESDSVAIDTLLESDKSQRREFRFDSIYHHIHVIPMNEHGKRILQLITIPDWKELLLDLLFEAEDRSYNRGNFEYDACINGVYIFSHLDGDIARLIRFREAVSSRSGQFEALCFPSQVPFLREYLGQNVTLKTIDMNSVEEALGPERRNLFDR